MMAWLEQTGRWVSILAVLAVGSLVGGCCTSEAVFSDLPDLAATPATDDGRVFQVGDWVTIYYVVTNAPLSHEERIKPEFRNEECANAKPTRRSAAFTPLQRPHGFRRS